MPGLDYIDPRVALPVAAILWVLWVVMVWRDRRVGR